MHRHGCALQMGATWYHTANMFSAHHKRGSFQRKQTCDFTHVLQLIWIFSYQEKDAGQETFSPAKDYECCLFNNIRDRRGGKKAINKDTTEIFILFKRIY